MRRIGIFIDVNNIYHFVDKLYKDKKLDYQKYYDYVADLGEIKCAYAYGTQERNEAKIFIKKLKEVGFKARYKTPRKYQNIKRGVWGVGITIDVMSNLNKLDLIVLGSEDRELIPLIRWCIRQNKEVIVLAAKIPSQIQKSATACIEIPFSMVQYETHKANAK